MKKLFMAIALILCAAVVFGAAPAAKKSAAAPKKSAPASAAKKAPGRGFGFGLNDPEIQKQLGLSADQKKKLDSISKTYSAKFEAQRKNMPQRKFDKNAKPSKADMEKMQKNMQTLMKLHQEYQTAQNKVLTKAQLSKYESIQKKRMEEFRKKFPGGPGMGPGKGPGAKSGKAPKK
ncbi:MAG: hypothetical protein ILO36_03625 [Abditibacteriota bacterium]|nr:hypothetical protein [Abditibacteriota bacterium]